jgi:hypothetical protein
MEEIIVVGLDQHLKILQIHILLIRDASRLDPMKQYLWFGLQEDDQVWWRDLSIEEVKNLFVKGDLMVVQIDGGEDTVFVKEVVTKSDLVEQIELGDFPLLLKTIQQEEDLGLKGIFFTILIEIGEERVVLCFFQNTSGVERLCQESGQACFSNTDRTFYDDISEHNALSLLMFPNTTSLLCRDLIRFIPLEHRGLRLLDEFYCFILSPNSLDFWAAAITASIKIFRKPPSSSL